MWRTSLKEEVAICESYLGPRRSSGVVLVGTTRPFGVPVDGSGVGWVVPGRCRDRDTETLSYRHA